MASESLTLIGIPTLNGPERLRRALRSVWNFTRWDQAGLVKVLVCDDGSRQECLEENRRIVYEECRDIIDRAGLELLTNDGRKGISFGWNRMVKHSDAGICVLINDDVEVAWDWLDVLQYTLRENHHVGMVSLNAYSGLYRDYFLKGVPEHIAWPRPDYKEAALLDGQGTLLSSNGYAFGFRRKAYDEVGGFDPRYFCYYEELDFGVMLRVKGYFHYIATHPTIFHLGGATNSQRENLDAGVELHKSRRAFGEKWHKTPMQLRKELTPALGTMPLCKVWNSTLANVRD